MVTLKIVFLTDAHIPPAQFRWHRVCAVFPQPVCEVRDRPASLEFEMSSPLTGSLTLTLADGGESRLSFNGSSSGWQPSLDGMKLVPVRRECAGCCVCLHGGGKRESLSNEELSVSKEQSEDESDTVLIPLRIKLPVSFSVGRC